MVFFLAPFLEVRVLLYVKHLSIYLNDTPGYQSKMGIHMGTMASVSSVQPLATGCYSASTTPVLAIAHGSRNQLS
jgi:hypothetical protein